MSCKRTYFSKEIWQNNDGINYFVFIILFYFSFFTNLFAEFYKFFKCRLFNKNSRKSTENVCEEWEITETNNWIWLLKFDDKS